MKLLEPLQYLVKKYTMVTNHEEWDDRDATIHKITDAYKEMKDTNTKLTKAIKYLKRYNVAIDILLDCSTCAEYNNRLCIPLTEERFKLLKEVFTKEES